MAQVCYSLIDRHQTHGHWTVPPFSATYFREQLSSLPAALVNNMGEYITIDDC
jgi:hypothetical protein